MAEAYKVPGPLPDKRFHVVGAAIIAIVVPTIAVALRYCSRGLGKSRLLVG